MCLASLYLGGLGGLELQENLARGMRAKKLSPSTRKTIDRRLEKAFGPELKLERLEARQTLARHMVRKAEDNGAGRPETSGLIDRLNPKIATLKGEVSALKKNERRKLRTRNLNMLLGLEVKQKEDEVSEAHMRRSDVLLEIAPLLDRKIQVLEANVQSNFNRVERLHLEILDATGPIDATDFGRAIDAYIRARVELRKVVIESDLIDEHPEYEIRRQEWNKLYLSGE